MDFTRNISALMGSPLIYKGDSLFNTTYSLRSICLGFRIFLQKKAGKTFIRYERLRKIVKKHERGKDVYINLKQFKDVITLARSKYDLRELNRALELIDNALEMTSLRKAHEDKSTGITVEGKSLTIKRGREEATDIYESEEEAKEIGTMYKTLLKLLQNVYPEY